MCFFGRNNSGKKTVSSKGLSTEPWGVPMLTIFMPDALIPDCSGSSLGVKTVSASVLGMTVLNAE